MGVEINSSNKDGCKTVVQVLTSSQDGGLVETCYQEWNNTYCSQFTAAKNWGRVGEKGGGMPWSLSRSERDTSPTAKPEIRTVSGENSHLWEGRGVDRRKKWRGWRKPSRDVRRR